MVRQEQRQRADTKKARLTAFLEDHRPERITETIFCELEQLLAPVSRPYLRQLLRATDLPMDDWVRGISLHSASDLRTSLIAFAELYSASDDHPRHSSLRNEVITAKVRLRARLSKENNPAVRAELEAMLLDTMTWLENPGVFPLWARLKR